MMRTYRVFDYDRNITVAWMLPDLHKANRIALAYQKATGFGCRLEIIPRRAAGQGQLPPAVTTPIDLPKHYWIWYTSPYRYTKPSQTRSKIRASIRPFAS